MVYGETFYAKFTPSPSIDITGYVGTWQLSRNTEVIAGYYGTLPNNGTDYELTFQSEGLPRGQYQIECFNEFQDGFIECFYNQSILIE